MESRRRRVPLRFHSLVMYLGLSVSSEHDSKVFLVVSMNKALIANKKGFSQRPSREGLFVSPLMQGR